MSARETISLAHTARCKLQLAADRPDRNLRFILGHAFTLDKIRLAIAEIETDDSDDERIDGQTDAQRERRVSFRGHSPRPSSTERRRSPPPDQFAHLEDTDSGSDEDGEEDLDAEDDGLSLQRFGSASAKPPQMVEDDSSSSDEDEPKSPPPLSEDELKAITGGDGNVDLAKAYNHVAGCPCHGHSAPQVQNVWDVPQKIGQQGVRMAVVQVA